MEYIPTINHLISDIQTTPEYNYDSVLELRPLLSQIEVKDESELCHKYFALQQQFNVIKTEYDHSITKQELMRNEFADEMTAIRNTHELEYSNFISSIKQLEAKLRDAEMVKDNLQKEKLKSSELENKILSLENLLSGQSDLLSQIQILDKKVNDYNIQERRREAELSSWKHKYELAESEARDADQRRLEVTESLTNRISGLLREVESQRMDIDRLTKSETNLRIERDITQQKFDNFKEQFVQSTVKGSIESAGNDINGSNTTTESHQYQKQILKLMEMSSELSAENRAKTIQLQKEISKNKSLMEELAVARQTIERLQTEDLTTTLQNDLKITRSRNKSLEEQVIELNQVPLIY